MYTEVLDKLGLYDEPSIQLGSGSIAIFDSRKDNQLVYSRDFENMGRDLAEVYYNCNTAEEFKQRVEQYLSGAIAASECLDVDDSFNYNDYYSQPNDYAANAETAGTKWKTTGILPYLSKWSSTWTMPMIDCFDDALADLKLTQDVSNTIPYTWNVYDEDNNYLFSYNSRNMADTFVNMYLGAKTVSTLTERFKAWILDHMK